MRVWILSVALSVAVFLSGCNISQDNMTSTVVNTLHGGILATFEVDHQKFNVWITNPDTIQQVLDLQDGTGEAHIVNGMILSGPGEDHYNAPYSWHLDPEDVQLTSLTDNSCNFDPSYIQQHLSEVIQKKQRFCPTAAELSKVQDLRMPAPAMQKALALPLDGIRVP